MRRRSRGGAQSPNAQAPKAAARKSRIAPKAGHPRITSTANVETEVARLARELKTAQEQQSATSEVLQIISRSAFDLQTVLNRLVDSAARLCDAEIANIWRPADGAYRMAASYGVTSRFKEYLKNKEYLETIAIGPDHGSVVGRTLLTGKVVHVLDVQADPDYKLSSIVALGSYRTTLGVPLLREGVPIGVLFLGRTRVEPFTQQQIDLIATFADQAVIAVENTRLLNELRGSLRQQTATADVLKIISRSTFDLRTVLQTLLESAARFCDADKANIAREKDGVFYAAEAYGYSGEFLEYMKNIPIKAERGLASGRALIEGRVVHITDVAADPEYTLAEGARLGDYRTILCVPMLREGVPIGLLVLTRSEVQAFTNAQIELVTTFADQAAIAIENVRLFEAEKQRSLALVQANRDLAEREAKIRRLVDANIVGIFIWEMEGRVIEANDAFLRMIGYDRADLASGLVHRRNLTPPEWSERDEQTITELKTLGTVLPFEKEYYRKDGNSVPVLLGLSRFAEGGNEGVAFVLDLTERKRAEVALRESEQALRRREKELRDILETIPAMTVTVLPDGSDVFIGKRYVEFSGLSADKARRSGWKATAHPDDVDEHVSKWRSSLVSGEPIEIETRFRRADGEYRWFLARAAPLRDGQGNILNWYEVLTDITERKRAEERLRVQHTVAQILAEAATIEEVTLGILRAMGECLGWDVGALWRVDREAAALRCVELWHKASIEVPEFERVSREFTFVPSLGLPGRVWSSGEPEYISDVVADENFPRGAIAQREGLHAAFGFPILLGREVLGVIEFFSREIRLPDQELLNMLATIGSQIGQFIERKRAEAELRESEQNYRMLFESIDEGFCIIEVLFDQNEKPVDYRFLQISPSFERQTGIKNAAGRRMREIAPQHEEHWFEIYGSIALTGEPMRFENEAKQLGRWYDVYAFRVEDPQRRRVGILFNDITERKRAEVEARDNDRRYREVQAELAHASRVATIGQLMASIAHEIRQPITATINNAEAGLNFLNAEPPDLEEVRQALGDIVSSGKRAGDVIDRIRALIKKAPPRKEGLEINETVLEVIALTRAEVLKNGVSVRTQLAEGLPHVHGDRVQLQQVLLNLIINAIEAMRDGGEEDRELLISTRNEPDGVCVEARYSGPGFAPASLERVFEAFYSTKSGGLGLGLSVCRSIIEAHNGRLWASPNLPRGAIFRFIAPAHPAATS
jgi:PAS domain S-box-containing protein